MSVPLMSQTSSLPCRLKKFLSAIPDTMLVAIVIPISCLKLLYFRGTWGLLILFTHSSHFTLWFYRCSYSRTGIPILLVYFFHYVMETRINTCLSPIGLMKIPAALLVPSLNIGLYQSLTKFIFISVMDQWAREAQAVHLDQIKNSCTQPSEISAFRENRLSAMMLLKFSKRSPVGPSFHKVT